jgi:integrase/recombinase XerD
MSKLRNALEEYLAVQRALGFKLDAPGRLLHQFVDFAETERTAYITRDLALRWATQREKAQPTYWANRLSVVRQFAEYHSAIDCRTEIPPVGLLLRHFHKRSPHLCTDRDIERLLASAQKLRSPLKLQSATYFSFFGLLAVTGMRVRELLHLDREDADLTDGVLTIRRTKFGKSRLIPLHVSTRDVLSQYAALRDRIFPSAAVQAFFISERNARLNYSTVWRMFVKLTREIGLPSGTGSGLRLHDLRHRFVVRTMCRLYRDGQNVERGMTALATYLGHVDVASTYWYLSAVPELLLLASHRLDGRIKEATQ